MGRGQWKGPHLGVSLIKPVNHTDLLISEKVCLVWVLEYSIVFFLVKSSIEFGKKKISSIE